MRFKAVVLWGLLALGVAQGAWGAEAATKKVTVLAGQQAIAIENAVVDGDDLLVPLENVQAITGFELKPDGMCAGEVCLPLPKDQPWVVEQGGRKLFHATRFAKKVDQAFAADDAKAVWCFTAVPRPETSPLLSGLAPDFALEDRNGKTVKLSDYRGKKVLVQTWASWCACRFDLAGWQKVYEDLKDKNFEIIAVAEDTGGHPVADKWYDKANATYTGLVDPQHTVSSLYQMVNGPTGVWVDETGHIVRPPEVSYSKQHRIMGQLIGDDRYAAGVRDWVANGNKSEYVVPQEALKPKLVARSSQERLADAHFLLGAYFSSQGNKEQANAEWHQAQKLNPDSWNYHRQEWSFDKAKEMPNWLAKVKKLGDKPYYAPVEFPAPKSEPAAKD